MITYIPYVPIAPQLPHNGGGNIVFPCVLLAVGIACFVYALIEFYKNKQLMERYYKKNLFIAPASYFIENLEGQEKENFKNVVFQYDNMVCGMVDGIDFKNKRFSVTFKVPDKNYNYPIVTLSIDYLRVDLSKFHFVKSVQRIDDYHFIKIKEQDIIDIIKNKAYD